jgi:hypothetical protein
MNRHEEMKKITSEMGSLAVHYEDGLILDVEYLNKAIDLLLSVYPRFTKCCNCGEEKEYKDMFKDGVVIDDVWQPICNDCFKFAHKEFLCIWGVGYAPHGKINQEYHSFSWFTQDLGYEDEHRDAILKLELGESMNIQGIMEIHSIIRIK